MKWIYNIKLNECLSANSKVASENQTKPYKPLINNCTTANNYKWYFDPYPNGYIRSALNKNKCLYLEDVKNGKIKVDTCDINKNVDFEYTNDGLIKSPLSPNECLGKGDRNNDPTNATGGYLKPCKRTDDQIWTVWDRNPATLFEVETQNVWIYNPSLKQCLISGTSLGNRPKIGKCVDSQESMWEIPKSQDGFFKSLKSDWYLNVSKISVGTIIMSDTVSPSSIIKYIDTNKSIVSSLNQKKCLGKMSSNNKDDARLTLNDCDNTKPDQKWEIRETFPNGK